MCRLLFSIFMLALSGLVEASPMPSVEFRRTEKQAAFYESEQQAFLYVAGVGAGKSHAGGMYCIKRTAQYPKSVGLVAANTYKQLSRTTLKKLRQIFTAAKIPYVYNKRPPAEWNVTSAFEDHEGIWTVANGKQWECASLENYDALRGAEYSEAWIDETRDTHPDAINVILGRFRGYKIIYPNLIYQLRVTTTPNGFDHVWSLFANEAKNPDGTFQTKLPDSGYVQASTRDNIYEPDLYKRLITQYGKRLAEQEIEGQFVNLATGRAFEFNRQRNVKEVPYRNDLPLIFSMDFNVAPLCGMLMQIDLKARSVNILDEIFIPDSAQTADACREFVLRAAPYKPHTVKLAGDASGKNRTTTTTETNHSIMVRETHGKFPRVDSDFDTCNPTQFSRVMAANALMNPAVGEPRFWVSEKCSNLILDFEQVAFEPGTQSLAKNDDPQRTHCADAATYPVAKHFPILDDLPRSRTFGSKGGGFFG